MSSGESSKPIGESKHISDPIYLTKLVGRPLVPFFDGADVVNEDLKATQLVLRCAKHLCVQ